MPDEAKPERSSWVAARWRDGLDRFLEAGPIVVHDLSAGPTPRFAAASSHAMSSAPLNPDPFAPDPNQPPRGGGCGKAVLGCGLVVAVLLLLLGVIIYLAWPGFVGYLIQTELVNFREAVEKSPLEPNVRDEFAKDLDAVRLSMDDHKHFDLMQWMSISGEFRKVFDDGRIDPREIENLRTEIGRMKKIQGI
jgi:hypothetical protein